MTKSNITIVYHTRSHNVELLAKAIVSGIESRKQFNVMLLKASEAILKLEEINESKAIILGTPTYFGSASHEMKEFIFATGYTWFQQKWKNKVGAAFTHSSTPSGDKLGTISELSVFCAQHGMIWCGLDLLPNHQPTEEQLKELAIDFDISYVEGKIDYDNKSMNRLGSWLGLMSQSNSQYGINMTLGDIMTAKYFGMRLSDITAKMAL